MKKKGFTLIELLAVIVVLAIIALIATPIVLNVIENSKKGATERTAENYIKTVKTTISAEEVDGDTLKGKYTILTNGNLCPSGKECKSHEEIKVEMKGNKPSSGTIVIQKGKIVYEDIEMIIGDYTVTYNETKKEFVALKTGEEETNPGDGEQSTSEPLSFADDSWDTIAKNVKEGKGQLYQVGDTKEVTLEGYGTFTLRIANTSTPSECSTSGFSQTACGFVIEFEDIIINDAMDSSGHADWSTSVMRTYVNGSLYGALPTELKNVIIDTYTVSGRGYYTEANCTSTDKLYLLSTQEVWGSNLTNDTANEETRQLDYYKNKGVTTSNYSGAIKQYNETNSVWWLRSAQSSYYLNYWRVSSIGEALNQQYSNSFGVSPAFRIG